MKNCLLNKIAALVLALGSSVVALADNVVYGLMPSNTYGARTTSVDLDQVNTSAATTVTAGFAFADAKDVKCGVTAGDKYYAFVDMEDPVSYDQKVALVTFNFTTGDMVVVNDFSYTYSKPGYSVSGLTYDEKADKLYAIEISFNESDEYVTNLYSVSQEDGSMTLVTTWNGQYQAIASDHNGGFYLLQNKTEDTKTYPNLYKASPASGATTAVENSTLSTGWASYNSMVADEDGKTVWLVSNKNVLAFDLGAKTVAQKGELTANVAAVSYGKSTADGTHMNPPAAAKKQTRFLVQERVYGSSMGDIPVDVDSRRTYYYYNTAGKLLGSIDFGREYGKDDVFAPTDLVKTIFDENGNITNKDSYQWGVYDFDDYAWQKTKNPESFAYDEEGRLASDTTSTKYNVYTYYDDGTLESKSTYAKSTKSLLQKITYSNYDENGNPWHYSSTGAYSSYEYEGDVEYDDDGNKVLDFQYKVMDDPDMPGETKNVGKQYEEWTYENGILTLYTKSMFNEQGEAVPYVKDVYTPVDGDPNVVAVADSTYSEYNDTWYASGQPVRYYYADFSDMADMTAMEFAAEPDAELPNTVNLMFSMPQLAFSQQCKVIVYRDCLPVDTVNTRDAYNEKLGYCTYQDKGLKNGSYTYFLQPIFSPSSEFGPMDLDGSDTAEEEWTGYYCTNSVQVKLHIDLPKVTDLALTSGRVERTGSITSLRENYYAGLSWKNPADSDKYGFIKNSIYFVGAGVSETDTTNIAATNAEVLLYDEDAEAYVVTSYQYGKAISDTIAVKLADVKNLATGIQTLTAADGLKVSFEGNTVTLSTEANVSVFATDGRKVCAEQGTRSLSLDSLPSATYIICVEKNGKASAYKYAVK